MANLDKAVGFHPVVSVNTGVPRVSKYKANASAATITKGDAVIRDGTTGCFKIAVAGSGSLAGVAAETSLTDAAVRDLYVYDDPETLFVGQDTHNSTVPVQAKLGGFLCDIIGATGQMEVNLQAALKGVIMALYLSARADNDSTAVHPDVVFKIAKHQLAAGYSRA